MTMTYHQAHMALTKSRGLASTHDCIECGGPAYDLAYLHTCEEPLINDLGSEYSENPEDYAPMCRGCHQKLDNDRGAFRGWKTSWAKRDPKFLERHAEGARRNGVKARAALAAMQSDPVEGARIRARQAEGAKRGGAAQRVKCLTCGAEMNIPSLARHQKARGHSGREKLS